MRRKLLAPCAVAAWAGTVLASGPMEYKPPFVDEVSFGEVLTGVIPPELNADHLETFIVYLHLAGKFREEHVELFQLVAADRDREDPWNSARDFPDLRDEVRSLFMAEGHAVPRSFDVTKYIPTESSWQAADGTVHTVVSTVSIRNCQGDAYSTARETFLERKARYGSGSAELSRWIDAQIKVFAECGTDPLERNQGRRFDPPAEPGADWQPLEQHDRRYQIAAAYFYDGQYLEAAARFRQIAELTESPWRDIARYLVPRSLGREAIVNEDDSYLQLAIDGYRELANDPDYLAAFPSVTGQIRYLETHRNPRGVRQTVERLIVENPERASAQDIRDFDFLRRQWRAWSFDEEATDFERWRYFLAQRHAAVTVDHWRDRESLPWLYLALVKADSNLDRSTLAELADAADVLPQDAPGYFNMLLERIRIRGLLGETESVSKLVHDALGTELSKSEVNRLRLSAAAGAPTWTEYFRWAPVKALTLPWTDALARRLPPNFNRITTDTPLFSLATGRILDDYFTPGMILDVIDTPGLGTYLRGRLAIKGWTRAMLADDLTRALELSVHIRRNVPSLDADFAVFETATDKHFEAARIVLEYPAFSPWIGLGIGRVQHRGRPLWRGTLQGPRPMPDYVADGASWNNWWCASSDDTIERIRIADTDLQHPRFSPYSEQELDAIRRLVDHRRTAATTFFGPHVIRYAAANLGDPRVARTLHRLVFATRHACFNAPGEISRAAYQLLHRHFPHSEWAEKTPYWFDGNI